jgi:hypothetical protein
MILMDKDCFVAPFLAMTVLFVIASPPECCALSKWVETEGVSRVVIPAQAGIQLSAPGFWVAACGLAWNDGRDVFVIPAKAGIQGV